MNTQFRSTISMLVVLMFAFLAVGSFSSVDVKEQYLGDGVYRADYMTSQGETIRTQEGTRDSRGRWDGSVKESRVEEDGYTLWEYKNGERHGWSKIYDGSGNLISSDYYQHDVLADPPSEPQNTIVNQSVVGMALAMSAADSGSFYQQLQMERPWFIDGVQDFNVTVEQLIAFLDEIESYILSESPQSQEQFDTAYSDAVKLAKEKEAYQPVYAAYNNLLAIEISEANKNNELRLAVLDRYETAAESTFGVLQASYPQYLTTMESNGATLTDLQRFTDELDSRMDMLDPLNVDDPMFTIEVDTRLDATLRAMQEEQFDFGTMANALLIEYAKLSRAEDPLYQAAKHAYFGDRERDRTHTDWRITEIYIATMGYAPDHEGLQYWVQQIATNPAWNPTSVAQSFFDQPLVKALYPVDQGYPPFITALYQNIFGRSPDDAGRAYWLAELESGRVLRNQMIIALIEGGWANQDAVDDMARFGNQVEVGLAFAAAQETQGIRYSMLTTTAQTELRQIGRDLVAGVTTAPGTRESAIASIPGLLSDF
jgi:hypothetical protein